MQKEIKKQPIMLYTEQTPNPETLKFVTNQMIYPRKTAEFKQDDLTFAEEWSPISHALLQYDSIKAVYICNNFITLTKEAEFEWDSISMDLKKFIKDALEQGVKIVNEGFEEVKAAKEAEGVAEAATIAASVPMARKNKPGGRDRVMQRRNDRKEGAGGIQKKVHPIFLKTSQNRRKEIEAMLMDDGADPNAQDNYENTPLHYACLEGHKSIVKTLLRYGADVNIPNKSGNTPLHVCFAFKRDAIQDYLIEKGADVTARNNFGMDPYEVHILF